MSPCPCLVSWGMVRVEEGVEGGRREDLRRIIIWLVGCESVFFSILFCLLFDLLLNTRSCSWLVCD